MFLTIFVAVFVALVIHGAINRNAKQREREDRLTVGSPAWKRACR